VNHEINLDREEVSFMARNNLPLLHEYIKKKSMDVLSEKKNTLILKGCLQLVPDGKKIEKLLELDDFCDGFSKT